MLTSQRIAQICIFLFAAIALFGGTVQMYLGRTGYHTHVG